MTSPESASPARRDRFVEWSTRVEPVIGFAMATVGCVLIANEVAGQGWVTPAALDPYVAVLMMWGFAAFWLSFRSYEDTKGWRRVLATAGGVLAGVAVLAALYRVLIVVLIVVAIPVMQKKGQRW